MSDVGRGSPARGYPTVFIVGGTHGNERTGVVLVSNWQQKSSAVTLQTLTTRLLLANPQAIRSNTRYIHRDLNRSFLPHLLAKPAYGVYEVARAREIASLVAAARSRGKVFVIDLHTSTANMGITLITNTDPNNLCMAAHVRQRIPSANIYAFPPGDRIDGCLRATADAGMGLEIGPIPQGVVRHDVLERARRSIDVILDVLAAYNRGALEPPELETRVFLHDDHVYYPEAQTIADEAFIHRDFEGRDYQPLTPGAPLFGRLDGEPIRYEGPSGRCSVFVNEAAYDPERIAFSLTRPVTLGRLMR